MTRTIKFRAWDKKNKKLLPVTGFNNMDYSDDNQFNYICTGGDGLIQKKDYELMQFTGLLDTKGVEIYFEDYVEDGVGQVWIVKWNKTEISLLNIATGDIMSMRNGIAVKSNFYENANKLTPQYTEIPKHS
ncbi:MAG: YopX family protein [Candidatus Bathyarchaeota archaeon]